jgi:hypothetical protein
MPDPLIDRKGKIKVIDPRVLAREKRKGFQITNYRVAGVCFNPLPAL